MNPERPHLHQLRREYRTQPLRKELLDTDPFKQFITWLDEAIAAQAIEPNAFALATATANGTPSCRMVLMKNFDHQGITFFTHQTSRKAKELEENPQACAVFFWEKLERQVTIEGSVQRVSREECVSYFAKRPRGSQLGTAASKQGTPIPSRTVLEEAYNALEMKYQDKEIPCPETWTGFKILPRTFEFWEGRANRLHDRFRYTPDKREWIITRISP